MTNSPFATSQPLTISSGPTSRSCTGHQRFCLIGVPHSRCSSRNETSDCRAAGFVAGASPTGMLTRPKLIEPFQVVRMTVQSRGTGRIRPAARLPCTAKLEADVAERSTSAAAPSRRRQRPRTIARLWRDAVARGRTRAGLPRREPDGGWREVSWPEAGAARRRARERPARARRPQGRRVRDPRPQRARMGAVRLRARRSIGAVATPDLRVELAARLRLRPRALGGGRRARRGRRVPREGRRLRAAGMPRPTPTSTRCASAGRELRRRAPGRARRGGGRGRRGRPLHLHLHLGHDRAAEGLHDPPPQLLRDGARRSTRTRESRPRAT